MPRSFRAKKLPMDFAQEIQDWALSNFKKVERSQYRWAQEAVREKVSSSEEEEEEECDDRDSACQELTEVDHLL